MSWERTPDGHAYTCTTPGCGYVTTGDPIDIARHRLDHLARMLQEGPAPALAVIEAEAILRDDLERARKLWYPTIR